MKSLTKIAKAVSAIIMTTGSLFKKKAPVAKPAKRSMNIHDLIDDIGNGNVYKSHQCQTYYLKDPQSGNLCTVSVGTARQFSNTRRFMTTYTTLKTPLGAAIVLYSNIIIAYLASNDTEILKRCVNNSKITYIPMQVVEEGAICNMGVFISKAELDQANDPIESNYYQ